MKKNLIDKQFFAPVKKVSATTLMPGYLFNSNNDTMVEVQTEEGPLICNNCSSSYLLVPNNEIFPALEEELDKFGLTNIHRSVLNYSEFFVDYDFTNPENKIEIAKGDIIFPRISVENSYNSKYVFKIKAMFYRQICSNGMCLPIEDSLFETILSHSHGNMKRLVTESLEGIHNFFMKAKEISGEYEILMEKKIKEQEIEDILTKVLKETNSLLSVKDQVLERIQKENKENNVELNLFSLYNGINYFLQESHNEFLTKDKSRVRQLDEKILDKVFELAE